MMAKQRCMLSFQLSVAGRVEQEQIGIRQTPMTGNKILVNRAPVLTLWAAAVAERLGFNHDEALSLGKALAGLNAQSKGRRLGIFKPTPKELKKVRERERGEEFW